ncbi:hypothetical protein [Azotobacter chroococcum]|nr:hypothetical protein [Azotobacter chroococcum]
MWAQENRTAPSAAKAAVVNFTRSLALASNRAAIVTGTYTAI